MVQAFIDINERANRIINILKAKYGLKDKSQAIELAMDIIEKEHLEPELRPEYIKKIEKIRQSGKYTKFSSVKELRNKIEKGKKG
jgi:hypothetical protein